MLPPRQIGIWYNNTRGGGAGGRGGGDTMAHLACSCCWRHSASISSLKPNRLLQWGAVPRACPLWLCGACRGIAAGSACCTAASRGRRGCHRRYQGRKPRRAIRKLTFFQSMSCHSLCTMPPVSPAHGGAQSMRVEAQSQGAMGTACCTHRTLLGDCCRVRAPGGQPRNRANGMQPHQGCVPQQEGHPLPRHTEPKAWQT
jgi:hypothetical protein